ncbi:11807_t:CDS:2 [Ambispora gerdemannii]|uniref:Monothiol glutaredoxin-5, mitochondrial n=1 Tax=Ambispora gerdemannii TaxID=144530 RepID=A0A9N8VMM7_9GLOM|nr:11807_t:CDS:2 [Ambispora gerdemannii]
MKKYSISHFGFPKILRMAKKSHSLVSPSQVSPFSKRTLYTHISTKQPISKNTIHINNDCRSLLSRSFTLISTRHGLKNNENGLSPDFGAHRRFLSTTLKEKLDTTVKSNDLVLFMKGTCGFSRAVVQILDAQGVDLDKIKTFNVLEDQELRDGVKTYSSWPTVPQLYVKGEFVGGCDILLQMHQSGELEKLLEKEGIVPPEVEQQQS